MKKIHLTILFILFFSLLFSIGRREDRKTLTISKLKEFDKIESWSKNDGKWVEGEKLFISLSELSAYKIDEFPDAIILVVTSINGDIMFLFEEKNFYDSLIFNKTDGVTDIKISSLYSSELYGTTLDDIEKEIAKYYSGEEKKEINDIFHIYYYRYDDRIQYYLTNEVFNGEYILMDIIESNVSINTSSFENEYFESLFNDFQYFFSNMMHNEPQFKIMLCGKSEGRDYCYITLPNQDEMLKVFEGNTVAGGTIESIDRKKTALVFIKNGETFKIVKNN